MPTGRSGSTYGGDQLIVAKRRESRIFRAKRFGCAGDFPEAAFEDLADIPMLFSLVNGHVDAADQRRSAIGALELGQLATQVANLLLEVGQCRSIRAPEELSPGMCGVQVRPDFR